MAECGSFTVWRDPVGNIVHLLRRHGNIEHLIVEIDFLGQLWRLPRGEYTIPGASMTSGSTRDGYADVCSLLYRQIWEIKPKINKGKDGEAEAVIDATHYVNHANQKCGSGWTLGVRYTTRGLFSRKDCVWRFEYNGEEYFLIALQRAPGAICYHWEDSKGRELAKSEVNEAFRAKMFESIFGSAAPQIEPRTNKPRKVKKPTKVTKPVKTPQLEEQTARVGLTFEELPAEAYIPPFMGVPVLQQCVDILRNYAPAIQQFMQSVAVTTLFDGDRVAVLLDDSAYQRLLLERRMQQTEDMLRPGLPAIIRDSPSQVLGQPVLRPIVEPFMRWWNGLTPEQRQYVLIGAAVVAVAAAAGGVAIVFGAELIGAISVGAASVGSAITTATASVSVGKMVLVGGALMFVLTVEGKASARTPTIPRTPNPVADQIGRSVAQNLAAFPSVPAGANALVIGIPRVTGGGVTSIETVMPQYSLVDSTVALDSTLLIDGTTYRVVGLSQEMRL